MLLIEFGLKLGLGLELSLWAWLGFGRALGRPAAKAKRRLRAPV